MTNSIDRKFTGILDDMNSLKEEFMSELESLYGKLEEKDREIEGLRLELRNLDTGLEEEELLEEVSQEEQPLFKTYRGEFLKFIMDKMEDDGLSNKVLKEFLEKFSDLLDISIELEEFCGYSLFLAFMEILDRKYYASEEVRDFLSQNHQKFMLIFKNMGPEADFYLAFINYGNILILSGLDEELDMDGYKEVLLDLEMGMLNENKALDYTYLKFYLGYGDECKDDFEYVALCEEKYSGHLDLYLRYSSPYIGEDDFAAMERDFEELRFDITLYYKIIDRIKRDILSSSYENFTDSVELINDGSLKCPEDGFELSKREAKLMFRENEKIEGVLDKELYYCSQCERYFIYREDSLPLEDSVNISDRFYDDCLE